MKKLTLFVYFTGMLLLVPFLALALPEAFDETLPPVYADALKDIEKRSEWICEDDVLIIGLNSKDAKLWHLDKDKKVSWGADLTEVTMDKEKECPNFEVKGTLYVFPPNQVIPLPLLLKIHASLSTFVGSDGRTETSMIYRFGIKTPSITREGLKCRLTKNTD